jgi:hypothetical protein
MDYASGFHQVATALAAFGLAVVLGSCPTRPDARSATPWITTKQPLTL